MKLPISTEDRTLCAIDRAHEERQFRGEKRRPYLGMSSIGNECSRQLWYGFRWAKTISFDASTLRKFDDGHRTEDLMADRIRMVSGITLMSVDPDSGRQIGWQDFGGHFRGHCDGVITGLVQAPTNPHIWENKAVNEKKFAKLQKLRNANEKVALSMWDSTYYAQQILYMDYGGFDRAWMTVTTPGGRDYTAVRTESDPAYAIRLKNKAEQIIFSDEAPDRISDNEKVPPCVWCDFKELCRGREQAERNCRTCVHASAEGNGTWKCERFNLELNCEAQESGCRDHRYNPSFVPGEASNASKEENWIEYNMEDGKVWRDG